MSKRRILISVLVAAVLAGLVYWQIHNWRKFDWHKFADQTSSVNWWMIIGAVALIYAADTLRAFRWSIFLRPVKPVHPFRLIAPQFIGFAGLALLGRPGELEGALDDLCCHRLPLLAESPARQHVLLRVPGREERAF